MGVNELKTSNPADAAPPRKSIARHLLMARGESLAARAGIAVGVIMIGVLAASSWWTLHTYRQSVAQARDEQIRMAARLLSQSAESMLENGDLSALRRGVSEAALSYNLTTCRITLPDGSLVADASGGKVSVLRLPETWPESRHGAGAPGIVETRAGGLTLSMPLIVPGRGDATLEIGGADRAPMMANWEVQAGIGAICVLGMSGLLVVYRSIRTRLRGLGAIRDALVSMNAGVQDSGVLMVSDRFGPEAKAWNALLDEREALRSKRTLEGAVERITGSDSGAGDLAGACDALSQGLVVVDAALNIRYANGAAGVLLGVKRDQAAGQNLAALLNDPGASEALAALAGGAARARVSFEIERRGETPGDRAILRVSTRPMRRGDAASAIIVIEDVTQQRVADESRNAFVAQATHELRTPLTNIRLYVDTLVDDSDNDPQLKAKCLNVISQEARRLERIVGDMLSVGEIEAGTLKIRPGDVRLDALFAEVKEDFAAQAESKQVKLRFELPPKLPVIQADRDKFVLALHNLIGNALKYTPGGGAVTVRAAADAKTLTIEVADTGIGIKEEELELIFEKFYRAKDARINGIAGSGLGLALARQIVRLHGGDVTAKSEFNKGSTFTATFPVGSVMGAAGEMKKAA